MYDFHQQVDERGLFIRGYLNLMSNWLKYSNNFRGKELNTPYYGDSRQVVSPVKSVEERGGEDLLKLFSIKVEFSDK